MQYIIFIIKIFFISILITGCTTLQDYANECRAAGFSEDKVYDCALKQQEISNSRAVAYGTYYTPPAQSQTNSIGDFLKAQNQRYYDKWALEDAIRQGTSR